MVSAVSTRRHRTAEEEGAGNARKWETRTVQLVVVLHIQERVVVEIAEKGHTRPAGRGRGRGRQSA
jgi:hypothetical protein